jgi:DNA-binding CsgD family transcriptional regulator
LKNLANCTFFVVQVLIFGNEVSRWCHGTFHIPFEECLAIWQWCSFEKDMAMISYSGVRMKQLGVPNWGLASPIAMKGDNDEPSEDSIFSRVVQSGSKDCVSQTLSVLNQLQIPFAFLDKNARVIESNDAFKKLADDAEKPTLIEREIPSLREKISKLLASNHEAPIVHVCGEALQVLRLVSVGNTELVGLAVSQLGKESSLASDFLVEMFGLTSREAQIAGMVANGKSVSTIAHEGNVTKGTVRVQLKSIFRKTGVKGQGDLICKIRS